MRLTLDLETKTISFDAVEDLLAATETLAYVTKSASVDAERGATSVELYGVGTERLAASVSKPKSQAKRLEAQARPHRGRSIPLSARTNGNLKADRLRWEAIAEARRNSGQISNTDWYFFTRHMGPIFARALAERGVMTGDDLRVLIGIPKTMDSRAINSLFGYLRKAARTARIPYGQCIQKSKSWRTGVVTYTAGNRLADLTVYMEENVNKGVIDG